MTTYTFSVPVFRHIDEELQSARLGQIQLVLPEQSSSFVYTSLRANPITGMLDIVQADRTTLYALQGDGFDFLDPTMTTEIEEFGLMFWDTMATETVVYSVSHPVGPEIESYVLRVGGTELPEITTTRQAQQFLDRVIHTDIPVDGSGFFPGDPIFVNALPGVTVSENDVFTTYRALVETGVGRDVIGVVQGNDHEIDGQDGIDTVRFHDGSFASASVALTGGNLVFSLGTDTITARFVEYFDFEMDDRFISMEALRLIATRDAVVNRTGDGFNDQFIGGSSHDRLVGLGGNDTLNGGDGRDTLNGGDGDDSIDAGGGGYDEGDLIFAGAGNDTADGGYGNDMVYGGDGDDVLMGGFGADTVVGQGDDDLLSGGAFADQLFGGDGDDFLNGGFGHDLLNGGAGADEFFHIGQRTHGSDWVQDYNAAEGDVLFYGISGASASEFNIQIAHTENAGQADVAEAFVIHRPTGQVLWALVDGASQDSINLRIVGLDYDLHFTGPLYDLVV